MTARVGELLLSLGLGVLLALAVSPMFVDRSVSVDQVTDFQLPTLGGE